MALEKQVVPRIWEMKSAEEQRSRRQRNLEDENLAGIGSSGGETFAVEKGPAELTADESVEALGHFNRSFCVMCLSVTAGALPV